MGATFRRVIEEAEPIRLREPLAETLGAFETEDAVVEYRYSETVKMAGHPCPTVTASYLICRAALKRLYGDEVPVRGEIAVTVYGDPEEGVYGVMGQVFSFITGAAPHTGFRGLGPGFKRKDLLKFNTARPDPEATCFEFRRTDNGAAVLVKFYPHRVPMAEDTVRRLRPLMDKVLGGTAHGQERKEFQDLWMGCVEDMLRGDAVAAGWLELEDRTE